MRKKTLLLSAEFPPHGGGAGVIAKQIIKDSKLQNIQLDCVVNLPRENFIQRFCFEFIFYYRLLKYDLNNYDLIILNDTRSVLFASHFFSKINLNKCLLIAHGRDYDNYHPSNISLLDKLRCYQNSHLTVIKNCKRIVAVSHFIRCDLLERFGELYANKVEVSYCGISNKLFQYKNNNLIKRPDCNIRILTVSRFVQSKGYEQMYNIFKSLIDSHHNLSWDIYGDGNFRQTFIANVKSDGLEKHITCHGHVDREALSAIYPNYDLFLLLPIKAEAFGLVYLEAQALGVTAIGSDIGGIQEAINPLTGLVTNESTGVHDFIVNFVNSESKISSNIEYAKKFDSSFFLEAIMVNEK